MILIAAVGPTVATIIERDREKELIFRGKQYARAIVLSRSGSGASRTRSRSSRRSSPARSASSGRIRCATATTGRPSSRARRRPCRRGVPGPAAAGRRTTPAGRATSRRRRTGMFRRRRRRVRAEAAPTPTPGSLALRDAESKTSGRSWACARRSTSEASRRGAAEYYDEWRFIAGDADNDDRPSVRPQSCFAGSTRPTPTPRLRARTG